MLQLYGPDCAEYPCGEPLSVKALILMMKFEILPVKSSGDGFDHISILGLNKSLSGCNCSTKVKPECIVRSSMPNLSRVEQNVFEPHVLLRSICKVNELYVNI